MAYTTIPSGWIEIGKAIKKQLLTLVKDNLDDHETRLNGLEAGANKVEMFNFEVMGFINDYLASELVQIGTYRAPNDVTITEVKLILMNGSSSPTSTAAGFLSIDLQVSSDSGATWNTILAAQPIIEDGINATGSESGLVTFIVGGEDISTDDLIRVNVTSKKDTQGSFLVTVYGDVA